MTYFLLKLQQPSKGYSLYSTWRLAMASLNMPNINQVALSGRLSKIPISASLKTVLLVYADKSS